MRFLLVILILFSSQAVNASWFSKAQELFNSPNILNQIKTNSGTLSNSEMGSGIKEALSKGISHVVNKLGVQDGFNNDANVHIPLPKILARVDSALSMIGMSELTDELELKFNRAAEIATSQAKNLFVNAISQMSIADAQSILTGSNDAATQYLRKTMGIELENSMQPVVASAMTNTGAAQAYDSVMSKYQNIPFMPDIKANMNDYVVSKAIDGIFYYVAQEEAAIRTNPTARTSELLQKVFNI